MKKSIVLLVAVLFVGLQAVFAQTKTIKGTVTSADDGAPIPGAAVLVKGTTLGSVTNMEGQYTVKVPETATTLVVTFVGMAPKEVAITGAVIDIALSTDTENIDEVVVTALGIARDKKSLGYSVQSVNSDKLSDAASPNLTTALQGKVAGVQVSNAGGQIGSSSRIVIRGNSSLGDNQPLLVVDGVPISRGSSSNNDVDFGSGINDINPEDIENISVLKGGAAASLYGMRAGHGVILITTKSGKGKKKGVTVSYDGNYNVNQVYSIQKLQNKYGQGSYGSEYYYEKAKLGDEDHDPFTGSYEEYATGGYDTGYGFKYVDGLGGGVNDGVDESWGPRLDAGIMVEQFNSPVVDGVRQKTPWVSNPDNLKDFFELGYTQNHNLSVAVNGDKGSTRVSIGMMDQKGTMPNTNLKRYTAAINTNIQLNDMFKYVMSINYSRSESDNLPKGGYNASNPFQSMGGWFGRQVDMQDLKDNYNTIMENGYPYNWNSNYHNNPYWSMYNNTNAYEKNRVYGKGALFFEPTSWLKVEGRLGVDYYNTMNNPITTYQSNETISGSTWKGGSFELDKRSRMEVNADFIAYFNKDLTDDITFDGLVGANYRNLDYEYTLLGADELTVPNLFTISNVKGTPTTSMDNSLVRSNSVYAQGSFGWRRQVFAEASFRTDWDSTIEEEISYPAFSLSWLPSETFALPEAINYLKVRGGWAEVGSATSAYANSAYYSTQSSTFNGVTQNLQSTVFPPAGLRPESVVTTELGLEASLFNNRLGVDFSVYDKTTTDQIMNVSVSKATGYSSMKLNAGELNNKGVEIMLNGKILQSRSGLNWDMTLNWAKDKSEVVELYTDPSSGQSLESYEIGSEWSTQVLAMPGRTWGTIVGVGMKRTDDGAVIMKNGLPVTEGASEIGSVTPDWIGGINNEFSYKNWNLGFTIDIRKGGDIFSVSKMWGMYAGQLAQTAEGEMRRDGIVVSADDLRVDRIVTVTNPDADEADWVYTEGNEERVSAYDYSTSFYSNRELCVYDASYVKLRDFHLTYKLPMELFGANSFVKSGAISFVGTNLAILYRHSSNDSKFDPEVATGSGNDGVGLESVSTPPARSMGVKVSFKF